VRSRPSHLFRHTLEEPDSPAWTAWKERPMEQDYPEQPGWVRLPGYDEDPRYARGADSRDHRRGAGAPVSGVRRVRQASNWTAALLIAGVAAATGYFAHHAPPATPAAGAVSSVPGGTAAAGAHKPSLSAPVATSSGSGVTVGTGPGGARTVTYRDS
jgi:hypothetical protein